MNSNKRDIYFEGRIYEGCEEKHLPLFKGSVHLLRLNDYPVQGSHSFKDGEDVTGKYELQYQCRSTGGGIWVSFPKEDFEAFNLPEKRIVAIPLPTPAPVAELPKEAEGKATLTAKEMFDKWNDIYHSGSGHGNAVDHHIQSMREFANQECIELLKFLRKGTNTPVTDYLGLRAKYGKGILDNEDILNEYLQSRNKYI